MSDARDLVRELYELIGDSKTISTKKILERLAPYLPERYSVCIFDGEPLVSSFEVPKMEWVCEVCHRYYPFLRPNIKTATPELHRRYWELCDISRERRAEVV